MRTDYRQIAREKAKKYGLLPQVFERMVEAESGFNPKAVSEAGACGIAQIMPSTARGWGVDCTDPVASLDAAGKNLSGYIKTYLGGKRPGEETDPVKLRQGYEKGLRAYNAGPGAVEASRKYPETNAYVNKIIGPDKFSFTEALGAQQPVQPEPEPEQASTGIKLLAENLPKIDPNVMLGDFILKKRAQQQLPQVQASIDPVSLLKTAFATAPTFIEDV